MATPPAPLTPAQLLRRNLARYKLDLKETGPEVAAIKLKLADLIDEAGKHWCGDWTRRGCHKGGRLGDKCSNPHRCGSYMTQFYDEKAQAAFDEWFKDTEILRVNCRLNPVTNELIYEGVPSDGILW